MSIKQITLTIDNNQYLATYPNYGQIIEIDALKHILSQGQYATMALSPLESSMKACDIIDMIAYFTVLIPTLREDLPVKRWQDLDPFTTKPMLKVYTSTFRPWFNDLTKQLSDDYIPEGEKKEEVK